MPSAGRARLQLGTAAGLHVINTGKFVQVSEKAQKHICLERLL